MEDGMFGVASIDAGSFYTLVTAGHHSTVEVLEVERTAAGDASSVTYRSNTGSEFSVDLTTPAARHTTWKDAVGYEIKDFKTAAARAARMAALRAAK